jgi:hypothetical protein
MKSKLTINEFRNRLKTHSKIGSPNFKSSLFGIFAMFGDDVSKTFYGLFDDSAFNLTINSIIMPPLYAIKGKYRNINSKLIVDYSIEPNSKFGLLYLKFFPVFALFGVNLFFLLVEKNAPIEIYISFNLFVIFMIFFSRWDIKRRKKNMEQKFIEIFEITQ